MIVFDASALLAFLQDEPGAELVESGLLRGGACAAVNWSETAQKTTTRGADWRLAAALLAGYDLRVEPVGQADGERAAALWTRRSGLSLADRLCLAVAERLGAEAWTADTAWPDRPDVVQIR